MYELIPVPPQPTLFPHQNQWTVGIHNTEAASASVKDTAQCKQVYCNTQYCWCCVLVSCWCKVYHTPRPFLFEGYESRELVGLIIFKMINHESGTFSFSSGNFSGKKCKWIGLAITALCTFYILLISYRDSLQRARTAETYQYIV